MTDTYAPARLTKQRVIMHHDLGASSLGLVSYVTHEDEMVPRTIALRRTDVNDMGNPVTITVTIEPGDLLNDEG